MYRLLFIDLPCARVDMEELEQGWNLLIATKNIDCQLGCLIFWLILLLTDVPLRADEVSNLILLRCERLAFFSLGHGAGRIRVRSGSLSQLRQL